MLSPLFVREINYIDASSVFTKQTMRVEFVHLLATHLDTIKLFFPPKHMKNGMEAASTLAPNARLAVAELKINVRPRL